MAYISKKKWIKIFAATTSILLMSAALLVIIYDPFFHYHAPLPGFPYQIDNQTSQNPGMARNMTYDSVLIGSSMTVNFEARWFDELFGEKLIKLNLLTIYFYFYSFS